MAEIVILRMTAMQYAMVDAAVEILKEQVQSKPNALRSAMREELEKDFAAYDRATGKDESPFANDPDALPPGEVVFDMAKEGI